MSDDGQGWTAPAEVHSPLHGAAPNAITDYIDDMQAVAAARPRGLAVMVGGRRVLVTLVSSAIIGLLLSVPSVSPLRLVVGRTALAGLIVMMAFGLFEQWPASA